MKHQLLPYQIEGAKWLAAHTRGGLHDEMGVGKTAQAIHGLDIDGARRVIVVAPAGVVDAGVWPNEFRKFSDVPRKVIKGKSVHELGAWMKGRADVLILSYEKAAKWTHHLDQHFADTLEFVDAIVFDECHYLKGPDAQRTRKALGAKCNGLDGLARWALKAWFLSGTPMPNDPLDIWTTLRFCEGTKLDLSPFTARYFKSYSTTFSTRQRPRAEMLPELQLAIKSKFLRRTMDDVGLQLPPVWFTSQQVDGDQAEIRELLRNYPGLDSAILDAIEQGGLSFLDAQHIATLRRLIGEAKAPAYANLVAEELRSGLDRVVIGGLHTKALHIIRDVLAQEDFKIALFIGETSAAQRLAAVEAFQAGELHAIIGHLMSLGTGITLTAAAAIDIFEESWQPAQNAQFLKRVSRIGQTRKVRARFISLANSLDELVSERVAEKTSAIMQVQGA